MSQTLGWTVAQYEREHHGLTNSLKDLEEAPKSLATLEKKIADLQTQLEEVKLGPGKPKRKTLDPCEKHGSRFSFLRRSYSGKMKDHEDRERQTQLEKALSEATFKQIPLKDKAREYQDLKQKLDDIYETVFDGPTPGYPNEDRLEQQVFAANAVYERVKATLVSEKAAYEYITKAEKAMRECRSKLRDALEVAATSMFATWRSVQDQEAQCLQTAHYLACLVPDMVRDAQQHYPEIRPLEDLTIIRSVPERPPQGLSDEFYGRVKVAASEVTRSHEYLSTERTSLANRITASKSVLENAERTLAEYKQELCALRRQIFDEVAEKAKRDTSFGEIEYPYPIDEAPPSYEYEPPSSFVPLLTVTPTPLVIPSKTFGVRSLPHAHLLPSQSVSSSTSLGDYSPVTPTSATADRWSSNESTTSSATSRSRLSVVNSSESGHTIGKRVRPLPRPPGS
ncbi:hypothetical protein PQX77_005570 [Marasmius sp. AFHP31]|nr:hypothetical protein PQX77_005570 [Marasmius sp. AFHP31]